MGGIGLNYGWNRSARVSAPPARARRARAGAGFTDPMTDYPRSVGQVITGGAFIPNGHWPAEYDGGYLFADGGSGNCSCGTLDADRRLRHAVCHGVGGIADMAFVSRSTASRSTTRSTGGDGSQDHPRDGSVRDPGCVDRSPPRPTGRVCSTPACRTAGDKVVRAGTTRYVSMGIDRP